MVHFIQNINLDPRSLRSNLNNGLEKTLHCRRGGGGATLLNPLKLKPPIADFLYSLRGFKGVTPKNVATLTPKGTDAEGGF